MEADEAKSTRNEHFFHRNQKLNPAVRAILRAAPRSFTNARPASLVFQALINCDAPASQSELNCGERARISPCSKEVRRSPRSSTSINALLRLRRKCESGPAYVGFFRRFAKSCALPFALLDARALKTSIKSQ